MNVIRISNNFFHNGKTKLFLCLLKVHLHSLYLLIKLVPKILYSQFDHELVQRLLDGLRLNGNVWGPKVDLLQRPLNLLSPLWSAFELALTPLAHFGQAWNVILQTTVIWLPALSSSRFFSSCERIAGELL